MSHREQYSLSKALRDVVLSGGPKGFEAECHFEELRQRENVPELRALSYVPSRGGNTLHLPLNALTRDVSVGGISGGASLVGEELPIASPLLSFSACIEAGATVLENLRSNVALATVTKLPEVQWVAETGGFTPTPASDPLFGQVPLTPHRVVGQIIASRQLLVSAARGLDRLLLADLSRACSSQLDYMCLYGTGLNNQPQGIVATPSAHRLPIDWTNPDYVDFLEPERLVEIENYGIGNFAFIMSPDSKAILRGLSKWRAAAGGNDSIYEAITNPISSNVVDDDRIFFGQFSAMTIGIWAVDLVQNPYSRAMTGSVELLVNMFCSVAIRNGRCFGFFEPGAPPPPLREGKQPAPVIKENIGGAGAPANAGNAPKKGPFR
jgi:hypothetical protein